VVIPIPIVPYTNYIRRRLFGEVPLKIAAYRQEVLCAAETVKVRQAIFLAGQIDRITGTGPGASLESEVSTATSEVWKTVPTIAYHLKDVLIVDGSIYKGRFKSFIAARTFFKSPQARTEPRHFETIGLASSHLGSRFFGHWLVDDCIQYLLAEKLGPPLCLRGPVYPEHRKKYQSYLGQNWVPNDRARIDNLIVYQDYHWGTAQDSLRTALFRSLRDRARTHLPTSGPESLVYLRRGGTGIRRVIQNEEKLMEDLTKHGFVIVDFETESLDGLLGKLASAKIVVSLEGSHASHCTFSLPEYSGLILLQPADRFLSFHRGWTTSAGVWFGFVVGVPGEHGYFFSSSEILQSVDLMMKKIAHSGVHR
jgi:hypothetical protein